MAVVLWVNIVGTEQEQLRAFVQRSGYLGLLVASAFSGFNLLVPVPVVAFFPLLMEAGLQPLITIVIIAVGMTLGDLVGFLIGRMGREAFQPEEGQMLRRLNTMREKHRVLPYAFLFLYASFAPVPNELVVMPMAFLRYSPAWMFMAVGFGNMIFNGLIAAGFLQMFSVF